MNRTLIGCDSNVLLSGQMNVRNMSICNIYMNCIDEYV